jgi:hypothetical protein
MRKSCKFRRSEIPKKWFVSQFFRKIAKSSSSSENIVRKEAKKAQKNEKRTKEGKKRGNLIEKHYFFYLLPLHVLKVGYTRNFAIVNFATKITSLFHEIILFRQNFARRLSQFRDFSTNLQKKLRAYEKIGQL